MIISSYLKTAIDNDDREKKINTISEQLSTLNQDFVIVFTGMSGALIAPAVASKINKKLLMVRPKGKISHSYHEVEGYLQFENYVIIDDLIHTGNTINLIKDRIEQNCNKKANLLAIILYNYNYNSDEMADSFNVPICDIYSESFKWFYPKIFNTKSIDTTNLGIK